jgi:hypothetical protein
VVLVAVAVVSVVTSIFGSFAAAGGGEAPRSGGREPATETLGRYLSLVEQSAWVGPEGSFDLKLRIDGAPAGAQLSFAVYRSVDSRSAFQASIDGEDLGAPLRPLPPVFPLEALPRGADGSILLTFPVTTSDPGPLGMRVDGQGVFPVLVSLVDANDDELDHFVTHIVRLPTADSAARALGFSLVVPFAGAPGYQPDGQVGVTDDDVARHRAAADALGATPGVPLAIDPVPETIESLADSGEEGAAAVSAIAGAQAGRQVLSGTYAPIDPGAFVASPDPLAAEEITRQTATGTDVLSAELGARPDRSTAVVDRLVTPDALTRLNESGVDQLVIPEDQLGALSGQAAQVTFTQLFDVVNGEGRPMRSVMADAALATRLTATTDPVLNAHLVLADLAVLFFDRPNTSRGAVLAVPRDATIPRPTYDALLGSLTAARLEEGVAEGGRQIVTPMTLDDLFDHAQTATSGSRTLVRPYSSDAPGDVSPLIDQLRASRARISSFATVVGSGAGTSRIPALDRQVLVASTVGLTDDVRSEYFAGVGNTIDGQLTGIVTPADQQVTLTDRSGDVPITIENRLDYPVDVEVVLASAKLEFPEGNRRTVTLPAATPTQVDVPVEAKASGAFPVDVTVQSPDGATVLGTARYDVRSTAVSGVGLLLSIGAGAFLLLWWARHFRNIRRDRRLVSTAAHPSRHEAPRAVEADEPTPLS